MILVLILARCVKKNPKANALFQKIKDKIFWNSLIRGVIQGTLSMQLSAGASILLILNDEQLDTSQKDEKASQKISSTLEITDDELAVDQSPTGMDKLIEMAPSLFILLFFNFMPYVFYKVLKNKKWTDRLHEEDVKKKIGTLYATVDPRHQGSRWYSIVFLVRRSAFVLITFTLFRYPGIQIQAFMYTTLFYLIYLHYWPVFPDKMTLYVETFNETTFLLICYHMVLFSNLLWAPELK